MPEFDEILLQVIDKALLLLGQGVKSTIYYQLEYKYNIKRKQIPDKIEVFSDVIEQIFGMGARNLEIIIMKLLFEKFKKDFRTDYHNLSISELTFVKYVNLIRNKYRGLESAMDFSIMADTQQRQEYL